MASARAFVTESAKELYIGVLQVSKSKHETTWPTVMHCTQLYGRICESSGSMAQLSVID